jgi:hypothetical protein
MGGLLHICMTLLDREGIQRNATFLLSQKDHGYIFKPPFSKEFSTYGTLFTISFNFNIAKW